MTDSIDTEADASAPDQVPEKKIPAGETSGDDASLENELAQARAVAEEHWAKYLRVAAEMENLRKRAARDVENARKYGIERFAEELLGVIDSLEMGLEAGAKASIESLLEGKQATLKLFHAAMEKSGIVCIDPEGEPFNPELHEAMTLQPSDTAEPGSVISVIQKGYELNGRLLRAARVVVASEPDDSGPGSGAEA